MRFLITGTDGFIGSHLTEALLTLNYKVLDLSYYNSFNHNGWLEQIYNKKHKNLTIVKYSI